MKTNIDLRQGDCLEVMKKMDDNSVDSIVTDPPYGINFMQSKWDYDVPSIEIWKEALRVLKPGGHLLAFSGSRTYHRMVVNIEDAGFEIRDQIMWVYGSGFPKSLNISKAIDKAAGKEGEIVGENRFGKTSTGQSSGWNNNNVAATGKQIVRAPATDDAKKWEGWGTALKPAHEPIVMARKPLEGTVVENVLEHGTGGLNIDGSRIETSENLNGGAYSKGDYNTKDTVMKLGTKRLSGEYEQPTGRFPANFIHDGSEEVVSEFPETSKSTGGRSGNKKGIGANGIYGKFEGDFTNDDPGFGDEGSAARYFKATPFSKQEHEPIVLARKPLDGTVVENVLEHGTGGLNIGACRVGDEVLAEHTSGNIPNDRGTWGTKKGYVMPERTGRFPANFIHDGSEEVVSEFPESVGGHAPKKSKGNPFGGDNNTEREELHYGTGSASRFFYCAKPNKGERDQGLETKSEKNKRPIGEAFGDGSAITEHTERSGNFHPTVKPIALMEYLCKLVTPPNGIVLDPFMGSGTTGIAAKKLRFNFIGIEMDEEYYKICEKRIAHIKLPKRYW